MIRTFLNAILDLHLTCFSFRSASAVVHSYSTTAAEELLVSAVRLRRDIVFDGTMTWYPFIKQVQPVFSQWDGLICMFFYYRPLI